MLLYILPSEIIATIVKVTFTGLTFKINVKNLIFNTCCIYIWAKSDTNKSSPVHILQPERRIFFLAASQAGINAEVVKGHGYSLFKKQKSNDIMSVG